MRIMAGDPATLVEIVLQGSPCRLVKRQESTFLELGLPNAEPVRCQIAQLERPGFRRTHPRGCEQSKQCTVGRGTQRAQWTESTRVGDQALDFLLAKDIGGRSLVLPQEDPCGWKLRTGVLCVHE